MHYEKAEDMRRMGPVFAVAAKAFFGLILLVAAALLGRRFGPPRDSF